MGPQGLGVEKGKYLAIWPVITGRVKIRLHQRGFRERVLRAYRDQCALCRLVSYRPDPERLRQRYEKFRSAA
jgi:hypothetical protein